jgi:hypothetical protein
MPDLHGSEGAALNDHRPRSTTDFMLHGIAPGDPVALGTIEALRREPDFRRGAARRRSSSRRSPNAASHPDRRQISYLLVTCGAAEKFRGTVIGPPNSLRYPRSTTGCRKRRVRVDLAALSAVNCAPAAEGAGLVSIQPRSPRSAAHRPRRTPGWGRSSRVSRGQRHPGRRGSPAGDDSAALSAVNGTPNDAGARLVAIQPRSAEHAFDPCAFSRATRGQLNTPRTRVRSAAPHAVS